MTDSRTLSNAEYACRLPQNCELITPAAPGAVGGGEMGGQAEWRSAVFRTVPL